MPGSSDIPAGGALERQPRPTEHEEVEVELARPPALSILAPERSLELLQGDEESRRAGCRIRPRRDVEGDDGVAERGLVDDADGLGRVEPRDRAEADTRQGLKGADARASVSSAVADVCTEADVGPDPGHRPTSLRSLDSPRDSRRRRSFSMPRPVPRAGRSADAFAAIRRSNGDRLAGLFRRAGAATVTIDDGPLPGGVRPTRPGRGEGRDRPGRRGPDPARLGERCARPGARRQAVPDRRRRGARPGSCEQPVLGRRDRDRRAGGPGRRCRTVRQRQRPAALAGRGGLRGGRPARPVAPPGRSRFAARRAARRHRQRERRDRGRRGAGAAVRRCPRPAPRPGGRSRAASSWSPGARRRRGWPGWSGRPRRGHGRSSRSAGSGRGARISARSSRALGLLLDRDGPAALGPLLARARRRAPWSTRGVLLAHRFGAPESGWPVAEDRFASDLLLADDVRRSVAPGADGRQPATRRSRSSSAATASSGRASGWSSGREPIVDLRRVPRRDADVAVGSRPPGRDPGRDRGGAGR